MAENARLARRVVALVTSRSRNGPARGAAERRAEVNRRVGESLPAGYSLIDAAVGITPLLQNLSEHPSDLRGAKLQQLRRNAARISRTRA